VIAVLKSSKKAQMSIFIQLALAIAILLVISYMLFSGPTKIFGKELVKCENKQGECVKEFGDCDGTPTKKLECPKENPICCLGLGGL